MLSGFQKIVVLAPHIDDGEFGCGGSINRWVEEGKELYYVAFSSARISVPDKMPKDILEKEVREATRVLGIPPENLVLFNYPTRNFLSHRQSILENMVKLSNDLKPDLVVLPSTSDTHQDHQTVSQEGFRAFKKISIIGYEMPYNNLSFSSNMFVILEEKSLLKKAEAVKYYRSQAHKAYATAEFIRSLARVRGTQIGVEYAESFEMIRWVIK